MLYVVQYRKFAAGAGKPLEEDMLKRRESVVRTLLSALLVCGGVAAAQQQQPNGGPSTPDAVKNEAPKVPGSFTDSVGLPVSKDYLIGAEDILQIFVWREEAFSRPVAVRPDGKITMPLIGDIQAEGLTPERLASTLKQGLSDLINQPEVTVSVLQVNSKKYQIQGGINRPGTYPLVVKIKVADALSAAGGFQPFADTKKIVIARGKERLIFNWNDYVKGKNLDKNIELENGDTIIVKN
jgi:polysaccharide biosynthesis/export protein